MTLEINNETKYCAISQQVSCELADETVVLALDEGIYYGLNPVGRRIWELLKEAHTLPEICEVLLAEYDVDQERCEQEVRTLLADLSEKKLIEVANEKSE